MAYEKTWQFDINRAYSPASLNDMARWLFWYYKSFLTGQIGGSITIPTVMTAATPSGSGGTLLAGTYYYRVTAIVGGVESVGSNEFAVTTSGSTSSVAMTWQAVASATGYNVYRGTTSGGENVYYAPGNVTSYTDTNAAPTGSAAPRTDKGTWWVVGSSNSSSASNFSSNSFGHDYLSSGTRPEVYTTANFIRNTAGSAHSWVVLRAPASVGATKSNYLLLDWSTVSDQTITYALGVDAAPTGGTNTAAPTMTNATGSSLATMNFSMSSNSGPVHAHGTLATDGSANILMSRDGTGKFISGFVAHLPADLKVIDTYPLWVHLTGEPTGATGYCVSTNGIDNASFGVQRYPDGNGGGSWAAIIPVLTYLPAAADSFDGSYVDWPLWLGSANTTYRSVRGRLQDIMYFGGGAATGSVDNPAGTPGWMVVGNFWFPTNVAPIL